MRINQTNDFRLMFRKKERYICLKWTKYTGNCRSRFFKKAGPKTFPVYKKTRLPPLDLKTEKGSLTPTWCKAPYQIPSQEVMEPGCPKTFQLLCVVLSGFLV